MPVLPSLVVSIASDLAINAAQLLSHSLERSTQWSEVRLEAVAEDAAQVQVLSSVDGCHFSISRLSLCS